MRDLLPGSSSQLPLEIAGRRLTPQAPPRGDSLSHCAYLIRNSRKSQSLANVALMMFHRGDESIDWVSRYLGGSKVVALHSGCADVHTPESA